jgi:hypothetical protein
MLNLTKRVSKLLEKTSSLETKKVCKEVLEMYTSVSEEQLSQALVEKLKGVKDSDSYVNAFVETSEKISKIKDLGIAQAISKIRESQSYHYPALRYTLDKFERMKISEGIQDFMMVEDFMKTLKDFTWDANVKESLDSIGTNFESLKESVLVSKALVEFRKAKGNFLYEPVCEKLEDHLENPTEASRSSLVETLSKFSFLPAAKTLLENLKKIQTSGSKTALRIIAENANSRVDQVYSTVILENDKEYFTVKGDLYKKSSSIVEKVSSEEFNSLSENIKRSYQIFNSPYFFVKEGKASFYLGRNKVEILEESGKKVLFNGKSIPGTDIAKNLISAGMLRLEEAKVASDIQFVNDIFENFFELDFAKVISSKLYEGSFVTLMKVEDKIYLNKVNTSMKVNEFFTDLNATQARNIILEFLGYDIKESMEEFIEKDEAEIRSIREEQTSILKNMSIVEGQITKIESAKRDAYMASVPQIKALEETLRTELQNLRSQYEALSQKLKKFEAKTSDAGVEVGQDVKLESGELATITGIDSTNKKVNVVTADGKTKELPLNKIHSIEAEQKVAMEKNEKRGDEEAEKMDESSPNQVMVEVPGGEQLKVEEEPGYVKAMVSAEQGGSCAGKEVEILAGDFTSKGDEDLIQVKCGEDLYFIEKKFIQVSTTEEESLSIDFDAEPPAEDEKKEEPKEEEGEKKEGGEEKKEEVKEEPKEEEKEEKQEEPKEEEKEEPKKEEGGEEKKEEEPKKPTVEELQAKLAKALEDLEAIKNDMKDTFTSNETIQTTITSLRGFTEALKKDLN